MPVQCPHCALFLKNDLVDGLAAGGAAPCPHCGETLTGDQFDGGSDTDGGTDREERVADPLDGWDEGGEVIRLDRRRRRWPTPSPRVAAAVAGAAAGALVGAVLGGRHRGLASTVGAAVGAGAGVVGARALGNGEVIRLAG